MKHAFGAVVFSTLVTLSGCGGDDGSTGTDAGASTEAFALGGWWEVEFSDLSHWTTVTIRTPLLVDQSGSLLTICGESHLGDFTPDTIRVPIGVGGQSTELAMSIVNDDELVGTVIDEESVQTITWRRMDTSPTGQFTATGTVLGNPLSINNTNAFGYMLSFGDQVALDLRTPFCLGLDVADTYDNKDIYGLVIEAALGAAPAIDTPYQLGGDLSFLNIEDQSEALRTTTEGGPLSNRDIIDATLSFTEFSTSEGGRVSGTIDATLREPGNSLTATFSFLQETRWGFSFVTPEVDQDNLTFIFGATATPLPNVQGSQAAQVFTAGDSAGLVQLGLRLGQSVPGGTLRIGIRPAPAGIPDASDASELASVTFADGELLRAVERVTLDLEESIPLSAGETYALTIEATGGEFLFNSILTDFYLDGSMFWRSAATEAWAPDTAADRDMSFQTLMLP